MTVPDLDTGARLAHQLDLLEAAAAGLLQGVAVVFPISGLGHGVLVGSLGNNAGSDVAPAHAEYLYAYLRLAVGLALLAYFWRDWLAAWRGLLSALLRRRSDATRTRWTGLLLLATVPSCVLVGLLARRAHSLTAHPVVAAACLASNGAILLAVWFWFRRSPRSGGLSGTHRAPLSRAEDAEAFTADAASLRGTRMFVIGILTVASLVPGISGVGLAICAGLLFGLTQEFAARVAIVVLTPVLITWGAADLPNLGAGAFDSVRSAVLVACACAIVGAYLTTALLARYFRTASLRPFGYYCIVAGAGALYWLIAQ